MRRVSAVREEKRRIIPFITASYISHEQLTAQSLQKQRKYVCIQSPGSAVYLPTYLTPSHSHHQETPSDLPPTSKPRAIGKLHAARVGKEMEVVLEIFRVRNRR